MSKMANNSELTLEVRSEEDVLVVDIIGRISTIAAGSFQSQLDEFIDREEKAIFLNCGKLAFVSSSGLRVILKFAKEIAGREKKLCLFALNPNVANIFEVSGFNKIVDIYPDRKQAQAALQS